MFNRNLRRRRFVSTIRHSAIQKFINRERKDYSYYLRQSDRALNEFAKIHFNLDLNLWNIMRHEQRAGFLAGANTRKFAFFYDMGMGKTLMLISLIRYFWSRGVTKTVLVLVPNKINKGEWVNEIKKYVPDMTHVILEGSSKGKWQQIKNADKPHVIIETYAGLVRMLCKPDKTKKGKARLVPDRALAKELLEHVQGIVMDESIAIVRKKGHGSLMHRLCAFLAKHSKIAYALNGTPFGSDPTDLWGQMFVIDGGETLGETLGLFRATFFTQKQNNWGGIDYTFDKTKKALLAKILCNRSIRVTADESTLPKINMIEKHVVIPEGVQEYYKKAKEDIIAARGSYQETKNAFLRMRQISSGFIGYKDDELGQKAKFAFDENPKLEMLLSLVEQIVPTHKVVIFHEFTFSGDLICRSLREMKINHGRLYGGTKDPERELASFYSDAKCRVFVLQNQAGGFGLDRLKVARYGIYYEAPVGTVLRQQTLRRIRRQGSDHSRVFIYDLMMRGTVDEKIIEAHARGIDLFKAIIDGKATV